MEKKNFSVYEAPVVEVVEMELHSMICVSGTGGGGNSGAGSEDGGDDWD